MRNEIDFTIYVIFSTPQNYNTKLCQTIINNMQKIANLELPETEFELHELNPKENSIRSYTTNDSPLPKRYEEIDTTSQGNDSILDSHIEFSNECQQFFEQGYCLNGNNCPFDHCQKNYRQILNQDLLKKNIQLREQFADLLLNRFSRINSFLS